MDAQSQIPSVFQRRGAGGWALAWNTLSTIALPLRLNTVRARCAWSTLPLG